MPLKEIKGRLVEVLREISGMGKVYDRPRNLSAEADVQNALFSDDRLHCWFISREAAQLTDQSVNQNFTEQKDFILLEGFYAVSDKDDSESAFDALVNSLLQAVNNDRRPPSKLEGTVMTANPPALRKQDRHIFANTLCHHAEIVMSIVPQYLQ
jgi:hypothetical protein